jgi:S-adenosylmethionine:tRNA ribosyltransferase-isomerase
MKTSELDYHLPEALIAQYPADRRDASRLLVLDRAAQTITEDRFQNLALYLERGDCLTLNDTRVIRARLHGAKPSGGRVEIFLLHELEPGTWEALVRPSRRVKPETVVCIAETVEATVQEELPGGRRRVVFDDPDVLTLLEASGEVPLPPYIQREASEAQDAERYQTVYARQPGAVAAPTAGLHFTDTVFKSIEAAGVRRTALTLHVGYGTFKPVQVDALEAHRVEPEEFSFSEETAGMLNETRASGGRIVAVGTTSTRVLETQFRDGFFYGGTGTTDRYIYPPYEFEAVDALLTNFHLPRSSLLALVCAFAGTGFALRAYAHAIEAEFRFCSYGVAMLIV